MHHITVQATDGDNNMAQVVVAITVNNIVDSLAEDPNSFVTTWETTMDNEQITIGMNPNYTYDFTVDWGDGNIEQISGFGEIGVSHFYETSGVHTVAIYGDFPAVLMFLSSTKEKLLSLEQWGSIEWQSMNSAFYECKNMMYNAKDVPDLSQVQNMNAMFENADAVTNPDLSNWDTTSITQMPNVFALTDAFNGNIENWNTENVTAMESMFQSAANFNRDLSVWKTGNVTDMRTMFSNSSFNGDIGGWNIQNVTNMLEMFTNSKMSAENYTATLIGWAEQTPDIQQGVTLSAQNINFCSDDVDIMDAIDTLTNDHGWIITDAGGVDCPQP
ncbi:BspA family leucine-rich repeat surface protein [Flagellimonas onchidii]|uniref:BspA family leucine-rich repeat surface protein n=1 Tax=Flagellimonas onchidii TaxID=2562684 RepID=UPI0010A5D004|nr:BspA family leucine-rich repeat surface protein [Allomuricauda onchidii]